MNKAELIDVVASRIDTSKKDASEAVQAVIDAITETVAKGQKVSISGFGVFERAERAARTYRAPSTGEAIRKMATAVPRFRPGGDFKATVSSEKPVAAAKKAAAKATAPAKKAATAATAAATKAATPREEGRDQGDRPGEGRRAREGCHPGEEGPGGGRAAKKAPGREAGPGEEGGTCRPGRRGNASRGVAAPHQRPHARSDHIHRAGGRSCAAAQVPRHRRPRVPG